MDKIVLSKLQYKVLNTKMKKNNSLLYALSESNTIQGEWESRLMYKGRMLAYSSEETGGSIFPRNLDKEKVNELIEDFGISNLIGEEILLLIEAKDYDDFLNQISELDDEATRNVLNSFFYDYQFYIRQGM